MDCGKERKDIKMEKTRYPQLSQYSTRLASFVHSHFVTNHQALANLGFFYKGQGDRVCCYECGITLSSWRKDDDPLLEHVRSSPECRHLATIIDPATLQDYKAQLQKIRVIELGNEDTDNALEATSSPEKRKKMKSPEYLSYSVRLSTFARFSAIYGIDVHGLADAGFYYTGYQDIVRCYACDGCIKRLEPGVDPWKEHCKWFPNCPHLEQSIYKPPTRELIAEEITGQSEEKALKTLSSSARELSPQEVVAGVISKLSIEDQKPRKQDVEPVLNTPAALAVLDFGYSRQAAKMAIEELRQKGQTTLTADSMLQVLISFEDKGLKLPSDNSNTNEISNLLEENEKLSKMMMCKRCRERQRNTLLLLCTHFCLCEQCSKEVSLCPEC